MGKKPPLWNDKFTELKCKLKKKNKPRSIHCRIEPIFERIYLPAVHLFGKDNLVEMMTSIYIIFKLCL